jgi:hypothetical protein
MVLPAGLATENQLEVARGGRPALIQSNFPSLVSHSLSDHVQEARLVSAPQPLPASLAIP